MSNNLLLFPGPQIDDKKTEVADTEVKAKGSDGGGGDMEARIAKLETQAEYIRRDLDALKTDLGEFRVESRASTGKIRDNMERDFRLLFGSLIVVALGLAALMAKGFHWIG